MIDSDQSAKGVTRSRSKPLFLDDEGPTLRDRESWLEGLFHRYSLCS